MEKWDDQSVDLIYLDPPFKSDSNYNQLFRGSTDGTAQYRAFHDTWTWDTAAEKRLQSYERSIAKKAYNSINGFKQILGRSGMLAYLTYMAERLEECQRLLKDTGSIYLHCDPTASHYLKIVMDEIFEKNNFPFRNEIIWHYYNGTSNIKCAHVRKHDVIFFYSGGLADRRFNEDEAREPYIENSNFVKNPHAYKDKYKPHPLGKRMHDVWRIPTINNMAKERLGYPTQKPESLLERIVKVSTAEGDIVLDPFCGCGTTVAVAKKLNRQFVGIDISSFAIDLIRDKRLCDPSVPVYGIPLTLNQAKKLAREQPFNFESWAVTRLPGFAPNTKQVADGGVDGRATIADQPSNWESKLALAQIKGGKFNIDHLCAFIHVINRDNAALGCFVTLEPVDTPRSKREIAQLSNIYVEGVPFPRMQIWSIKDYFDNQFARLPIMNDPYTGKPMRQLEIF
ncbi:MAG: site-specific DNA-methyltransferase [Bacteroidetes bacterium]|nr:site-specific DNA-methyltransferase [Bacteroidota bacterium]